METDNKSVIRWFFTDLDKLPSTSKLLFCYLTAVIQSIFHLKNLSVVVVVKKILLLCTCVFANLCYITAYLKVKIKKKVRENGCCIKVNLLNTSKII